MTKTTVAPIAVSMDTAKMLHQKYEKIFAQLMARPVNTGRPNHFQNVCRSKDKPKQRPPTRETSAVEGAV